VSSVRNPTQPLDRVTFALCCLCLSAWVSSVAVASLSASLGSAYNLSEFISFSIGCSL